MKPLILDYQTKRSEDIQAVPYQYDAEQSLNMVFSNGAKKPYIEINTSDIELMTKTKIRQESDDNAFNSTPQNMGNIETGAKQENALLELSTKTLVARERDDERKDYLMELTTKTRVKNERDDEHFNHN